MSVKQEVIVLDGDAPAEEDLQQLNAKNAAKTKYPPGCPIWYDLASSTSKQLDGRHGVVKNVFMDTESGARFYKLDGENTLLRQEQLAFAMNCPVKVRGMVQNYPSIELDGRIVCPKPGRGGKEASYSIQFVDGGRFSVKLGVGGDLVAYRKEAGEAGGGAAVKAEVEPAVSPNPSTIKSCLKRKSVDSRSSASDNSQRHRMAPLQDTSKKQRPGAPPAFPSIASDTSTLDPPSSITYDSAAKLRRTGGGAGNVAAGSNVSAGTTDRGTVDTCRMVIAVPLWLQRDRASQEQLFFYLIGSPQWITPELSMQRMERTSATAIGRETNCNIRVNYDSRGKSYNHNRPLEPITISVRAHNFPTATRDLDAARVKIQNLLLDFVGDDGSRGRLVYDMASSCWGDHRPEDSMCRAVRSQDPLGQEINCRWITVLEMPMFTRNDGVRVGCAAHLLQKNALHRLRAEANCSIAVAGDGYRYQTKLCDPYILLMGNSVRGIDKGAEVVEEMNRIHMPSCSCRYGGT